MKSYNGKFISFMRFGPFSMLSISLGKKVLAEYKSSGDISILRLFGMAIYKRVGRCFSVFGICIR